MNLDLALLDELAQVFADAALRNLVSEIQANTAVLCTVSRRCQICSRRHFEHHPCNTKFRVAEHDQGRGLEHTAVIGVVCPSQRTT